MLRQFLEPLSPERYSEVLRELDDAASPRFDFFLLVVLSCAIATFGLMTDSVAVIIGAMLVAPLMSPILGLSLASVVGAERMFQRAVRALIVGILLAVLLSWFISWTSQSLPFGFLNGGLPNEVMARTRPSPFDLGIALAGGMAAAYALAQPKLSAALPGVAIATALMPPLCTVGIGIALHRSDVTLGALLLFLTNLFAIAFAGIVVFVALGFRPLQRGESWRRLPRSLLIAAFLVILVAVPLLILTIRSVDEIQQTNHIREVVKQQVIALPDAQVVDISIQPDDSILHLQVTLRTSRQPSYAQVVAFQQAIASLLQQPVSLQLIVVPTTKLDPLFPPTSTSTFTPGPSPSPTNTVTPSATPTQTSTPTPTVTETPTPTQTPTPTLTYTPTPVLAFIYGTGGVGVALRETPSGKIIGYLHERAPVQILYRTEIVDGYEWVEVQDMLGRTGWVLKIFLAVVP